MSLLNDMLRDLAHQSKPAGAHHDGNDLLQHTALFKSDSTSWLPAIIIFIAVFVGVVAVTFFFHRVSDKNTYSHFLMNEDTHFIVDSDNKTLANTISSGDGFVNPTFFTLDGKPESKQFQQPANETNSFSTSVDQPVDSQVQQHINDLLQQANRAILMDRLTSPIEDNAYSYYQKILTLVPDQIEARQGLHAIATSYLQKAREQARLGNFQQAETLVQRARFVAPEFAHEYIKNHADDYKSSSMATLQSEQNSEVNVVQNELPVNTVKDIQSVPDPEPTQTQTETIPPFVVAEAGSVNVAPNAVWKDQQLAQQARALLQQGKSSEAQSLLKNFIVTASKPVQSTVLLMDIYFQQHNMEAVQILLGQANYLPAPGKAKINAQLLSADGNDKAAVELLEKSLSAADNDEDYRALLASLYHKTGNYQQSIISYQRLLASYGEKPAYWLGVALAYDGLAQSNNALQAYLHLREFPQLQPQVKTYLDQRIIALRKE